MNRVGIGICVRDNDGAFVLTKIMSFCPLCFVHVGETLGLFKSIEWLNDM